MAVILTSALVVVVIAVVAAVGQSLATRQPKATCHAGRRRMRLMRSAEEC